MDLKLVSKNNMGVVITLILAILLSQSKFFDFLIDTHLGRMVLLAFVILIAYTNKILGLVAVLFIIIAFNNNQMNIVHSYNFYEGFNGSGNITIDSSGNSTAATTIQNAKNQIQSNIKTNAQNASTNSLTTTTATSSAVSGTETFKGREGFNMTDRELNILRGKPSNSVPVFNNLRNQSEDVSPSDKSIFTSDYASF
jgi:hypothetical protein